MEDDLVIKNINLVYKVLQKMNLYNKRDEFYDIGIIGLVKASKNFNKNKGYTFSTCACTYIENEIKMYIRKENADRRKANYNTISLNKIISSSEEKTITLEDTLKSDFDLERDIIKKEEMHQLHNAIRKLNEIEYKVIVGSYGLFGINKLTQKQMAKIFCTNQTQISRIRKRAICKLKKKL